MAVLTAVSETAAMRRASSKRSRLVGGKPPSNPPRRKSWKSLYTRGSVRHSLRSTASGVLSVSRAISCVNRSSHRAHPRRLATKLAISDAPQPNSRSIVMAWTIAFASADSDISACSWIIFLQEKRENEHDGAERAQDPKDVHIGQCAALSMHQFVEPRNCLVAGVPGPKPRVRDFRAQCMDCRAIGRGIGSDVADEDLLVILSPSGNHRGHDGSSDTAADITHEIDHAGDAIAFLWRNSDVPSCRDGDK